MINIRQAWKAITVLFFVCVLEVATGIPLHQFLHLFLTNLTHSKEISPSSGKSRSHRVESSKHTVSPSKSVLMRSIRKSAGLTYCGHWARQTTSLAWLAANVAEKVVDVPGDPIWQSARRPFQLARSIPLYHHSTAAACQVCETPTSDSNNADIAPAMDSLSALEISNTSDDG